MSKSETSNSERPLDRVWSPATASVESSNVRYTPEASEIGSSSIGKAQVAVWKTLRKSPIESVLITWSEEARNDFRGIR